MVRLQDIADEFNISVSTVSRILNGKGRVADELRAEVKAYAEEVCYTPNLIAKSLKLKESRSIGLVVPDITNVYYGIIFDVIEKFARNKGYTTILFQCDNEKSGKDEYASQIQNSYVDGMIVATRGSKIWSTIEPSVLDKIVFIDNKPLVNDRIVDFIGCDNEDSAYRLTKLMIKEGYEKIVTVTGPREESSARERVAGYIKAMNEHNLKIDDNFIVETNFMYEDAWDKIPVWFNQDEIPSAILAHNNVTAYAALRLANKYGIHVPEDMGIACFDHIDIYGFMEPKFTNMMQPAKEMAGLAAEILINKINSNLNSYQPETVTLKHEFIVGETI